MGQLIPVGDLCGPLWSRRTALPSIRNLILVARFVRGLARLCLCSMRARRRSHREQQNDRGQVRGFLSHLDRWGPTNKTTVQTHRSPEQVRGVGCAPLAGSSDWINAAEICGACRSWLLTGIREYSRAGLRREWTRKARAPSLSVAKANYSRRSRYWLAPWGSLGWTAVETFQDAIERSGCADPGGFEYAAAPAHWEAVHGRDCAG